MVTIDLGARPAALAPGLLEGLPRRVALTLPELRLAAERAGGAPLPFSSSSTAGSGAEENRLADRLGGSTSNAEDAAYTAALAALHDPADSLTRRGLLAGDVLDASLAGAIGLLATPVVAVDLDVVVDGVQVRSWHRQADGAVATLSTSDGIVFELAWLHATQWDEELARVAGLPRDLPLRSSAFPAAIDVPFELLDAAGEALHNSRGDLLPLLADRHRGDVVLEGAPVAAADVALLLQHLGRETRGRVRAMVARIEGGTPQVVGVVSWVLLADGWHSLETRLAGAQPTVRIRAVEPGDLAPALAPVIAEVLT